MLNRLMNRNEAIRYLIDYIDFYERENKNQNPYQRFISFLRLIRYGTVIGPLKDILELLKEKDANGEAKKVKYTHAPYPNKAYMYSCPVCDRMIGLNCKPVHIRYCDDCGTKLYWDKRCNQLSNAKKQTINKSE